MGYQADASSSIMPWSGGGIGIAKVPVMDQGAGGVYTHDMIQVTLPGGVKATTPVFHIGHQQMGYVMGNDGYLYRVEIQDVDRPRYNEYILGLDFGGGG